MTGLTDFEICLLKVKSAMDAVDRLFAWTAAGEWVDLPRIAEELEILQDSITVALENRP